MKSRRTTTYRFYMLPELAEEALNAWLGQILPGILINGRLEPIPVEKNRDWNEYFELREVTNPSLKFSFEKRFWIGPALNTAALSYFLTFSGFTEEGEQEYLAGMRDAEKIIVSWEQADRPASFRWVLDFMQKQSTLPNLYGELHTLSMPSYYYLSVPRQSEPLYLTGIIDNESDKRFYNNYPAKQEADALVFQLSPGESLLFWTKKNEYPQKLEIVATAFLSCPSGQEIVVEQADGISIKIPEK